MSRGKSRSMSGTDRSSRFRKRPSERLRGDRVDVREPGQVADDRADRAAAAASRREEVARRAGPAHLGGDLARELEHLPVEEEEAREADLGDQGELLGEARVRARAELVGRVAVALVEGAARDLRELDVGRIGPVREVRVAVAELLGQVELEPLGDLAGGANRVGVVGPERGGVGGRARKNFVVPAPRRLAGLEGGPLADGDEDVLEVGAAAVVRVDVAGGDGADAERRREVAERRACGSRRRAGTAAGARRRSARARRRGRGGRRRSDRAWRARRGRSRRGRRDPRSGARARRGGGAD